MANLPMQTPRQGVFGDSCAVVTSVMRDGTKLLALAAEVVPGLPASLVGTAGASLGMLTSLPTAATDKFYGAFINLPINTLLGRTSLGEMTATRATVERFGRIRVRQARYQASDGSEKYINPFAGTQPTPASVGLAVNALIVAPSGTAGINPFAVSVMKWTVDALGGGHGHTAVATITWVSDDGTEVEIDLAPFVAYS